MRRRASFDVGDFRVHNADRGSGPRAQETVRLPLEGTPPGYFDFQKIRMLRGRELVASDTTGRDMAIVIDSDLARGFWGSADPTGKRLEMVPRGKPKEPRTAIVVGVFDTTGTPLRGREPRVYGERRVVAEGLVSRSNGGSRNRDRAFDQTARAHHDPGHPDLQRRPHDARADSTHKSARKRCRRAAPPRVPVSSPCCWHRSDSTAWWPSRCASAIGRSASGSR